MANIDIQKMYYYTVVDSLKKLGLILVLPDDDNKLQEYPIDAILLREKTLAGKIELIKAIFNVWKVVKEAEFTQKASLTELSRVDFAKVNEYFNTISNDLQNLFMDKASVGDVGVNMANIDNIVGKLRQIKDSYNRVYQIK